MSDFYTIESAQDDFIKSLCYTCGITDIKSDYTYLRTAKHFAGDKYFQVGYKDVGFYACREAKEHVRLILIVIKKEYQNKGYGKILFAKLVEDTLKRGKNKITLATRKDTPAYKFWLSRGFRLLKVADGTAQMELILKGDR